jgi:glycosyltransferase involved in cell wall biosynthesis
VVIPAYNEAENISDVLGPVKQWQARDPANRRIVVANDGSTDRTAEVAGSHGVPVVHSDQIDPRHNMGKAAAIKAGVIQAHKNGSDVVVTLDADLKMLDPAHIESLHDELARTGKDMIIGKVYEGQYDKLDTLSGERAMRMQVLAPWLKGVYKWDRFLRGFGFEAGINYLLPKHDYVDPGFRTLRAYRKKGDYQRQLGEAGATYREIMLRHEIAEGISRLRKQKKSQEARRLLAEYRRRPL